MVLAISLQSPANGATGVANTGTTLTFRLTGVLETNGADSVVGNLEIYLGSSPSPTHRLMLSQLDNANVRTWTPFPDGLPSNISADWVVSQTGSAGTYDITIDPSGTFCPIEGTPGVWWSTDYASIVITARQAVTNTPTYQTVSTLFTTADPVPPFVINMTQAVYPGPGNGFGWEEGSHHDTLVGDGYIISHFFIADVETEDFTQFAPYTSRPGSGIKTTGFGGSERPVVNVDVKVTTLVAGVLSTTTYNAIIGGNFQAGWSGTRTKWLGADFKRWNFVLQKSSNILEPAIIETIVTSLEDGSGNIVTNTLVSKYTVNDDDPPVLDGPSTPATGATLVALTPPTVIIPLVDDGLGLLPAGLYVYAEYDGLLPEDIWVSGAPGANWDATLQVVDIKHATLTATRNVPWPSGVEVAVYVEISDNGYFAISA